MIGSSKMADTGAGVPDGQTSQGEGTRLESWKEIAAYLGRDVSTVQRWERREGLPVHRHVHAKLGSVYALTAELDAWRRGRSRGQTADAVDGDPSAAGPEGDESQPPPVVAAPKAELRPAPFPHPPVETRRATSSVRRDIVWIIITLLSVIAAASYIYSWRHWGRMLESSASTAGGRTIAVLPLKNLSGDPAQEYFADGMTEALIARLSSVPGLSVTSRTSVMQFKTRDASIPDIARVLKVDTVLEGSVLRSGNRVRVIAQLIDARTDGHLWAAEYDREFEDVLTLQGDLAQAIAARVAASVDEPAGSGLPASSARPVSPQAYEHYLKGRFLLNESTAASVRQSLDEFQAAIGADATFAPAFAGLAAAHSDLGTVLIGATSGGESASRALSAAQEAIRLDPQLAEAWAVLARALMGQFKWTASEEAFRKAIELNPSDARTRTWYAEWLAGHRRFDEAVASARRGRDLDPLSLRVGAEYGWILGLAGRHEEAVSQLHSVLAVQPDHVQALWWRGINEIDLNQLDRAVADLERATALSGRSAGILGNLARAYARSNRTAETRAILDELRGRPYTPPVTMARVHLALGETDRAFEWLRRGVEEQANGFQILPAIADFKPLRDDPRMRAIFTQMGLQP